MGSNPTVSARFTPNHVSFMVGFFFAPQELLLAAEFARG